MITGDNESVVIVVVVVVVVVPIRYPATRVAFNNHLDFLDLPLNKFEINFKTAITCLCYSAV